MSMLRLPNDIIDDILVGLPVKDLRRFRCLSKSICTTIDSPAFVAAHLNRSRQTKSHRKLVFSGPIDPLHEYNYNGIDLDLDLELDDDHDHIHRGIKLNIPLESLQVDDGYGSRVLASCNGVVLMFISESKPGLVLWNPFTRRWKTVPLRYIPFYGTGLGYDSATNDYKIVIIRPERPLPPPLLLIHVTVFHLASNTLSSTDVVKVPFPNVNRCTIVEEITSVGVFSFGALHWILRTKDYKDIISFDIASLKFVKILPPLPPPPSNGYEVSLSLQGLEGRIFLGRSEKELEQIMEVFEVVDDGIGEGLSWRKLCKINLMELSRMIGRSRNSPILEDVKLLDYYSKEGNKILLQYPASGYTTNGSPYLSHLFWYDFGRGTYKRARISHHPTTRALRSRCEAIFCLESLVSLGGETLFDGSNLKSSV